MIADSHLSNLKQRFDFGAWKGARGLDMDLHVWRFALNGGELPGLQPERIEPATPPSAATMSVHVEKKKKKRRTRQAVQPAGLAPPRLSKSFWRPTRLPRALINIDVYECASRGAAHELLLQILGGFQGTQLARRDGLGIGDVAFATPGGAALAFARGNLVHLVRNASREVVDVTEIARQLDLQLVSRPPPTAQPIKLAADATIAQHHLSLGSGAEKVAQAPLYLKVFSAAGTLSEEDDQIVVRPTDEKGPHEVSVVAVYPDQQQVHRTMRLGQ